MPLIQWIQQNLQDGDGLGSPYYKVVTWVDPIRANGQLSIRVWMVSALNGDIVAIDEAPKPTVTIVRLSADGAHQEYLDQNYGWTVQTTKATQHELARTSWSDDVYQLSVRTEGSVRDIGLVTMAVLLFADGIPYANR